VEQRKGRLRKVRTPFDLAKEAAHSSAPRIWQPIQSARGLNYDKIQSVNGLIQFSYHTRYLEEIVHHLRQFLLGESPQPAPAGNVSSVQLSPMAIADKASRRMGQLKLKASICELLQQVLLKQTSSTSVTHDPQDCCWS
jgi:hypothetical protein